MWVLVFEIRRGSLHMASDILQKLLGNYAEFSRHTMRQERSIMCQIMRFLFSYM